MVLNDFQRGKLPYYVKPPGWTEKDEEKAAKDELGEAAKEETPNKEETDEAAEQNNDEKKSEQTDTIKEEKQTSYHLTKLLLMRLFLATNLNFII